MVGESLVGDNLDSYKDLVPPRMMMRPYLRCEEEVLFFTLASLRFHLEALLL